MENVMEILLIRHGKTKGNLERRYVGRTDEPLLESEEERLKEQAERLRQSRPHPGRICTSPMLRCRQTAAILFDGEAESVTDLRETDFGCFEYHCYEELKDDPSYQAWIDSGGLADYPEGEPGEQFRRRTRDAFRNCVQKADEDGIDCLAIVCHGGVIMSILSGICGEDTFYNWQAANGDGFFLQLDLKKEKNQLQWVSTFCVQSLTKLQ